MIVWFQTGCSAPGCKRNDSGTGVPLFYPARGIKQPPAQRVVVDTASCRQKNYPSPQPAHPLGQSENIFNSHAWKPIKYHAAHLT